MKLQVFFEHPLYARHYGKIEEYHSKQIELKIPLLGGTKAKYFSL
jgi:hypothetical protein